MTVSLIERVTWILQFLQVSIRNVLPEFTAENSPM